MICRGSNQLVDVTYGFTNRTPHMKLRRGAYKWLLQQLESEWFLYFKANTGTF